MSDQLAPGTRVHRYRIDAVVGVGGMGTVYRATRLDDGQVVAVKGLHHHVAKKLEHQKRFLREARAAMAVDHESIVRVYEVFEHDDAPMLAMELLVGESLEAVLVRERRLSLERAARVLVRVTSAVGTAHALGIVHRDLKPDNVFLVDGDDTRVKVLDFGIAKLTATEGAAAETAALTRTGALIGTPFYMSPEQAFGEKRIDQRADIWSLGIVLYRCLSGVLPTYGASFADVFRAVVSGEFAPIERLCPGLPSDVAALVARMLQRSPGDRPWDLREVHAVLERHAATKAPAFGIAVAPLFDELSADETSSGVSFDPALAASEARTLALTPSALRSMGAPVSPSGTVAMEPAARASVAAPLAATPARGRLVWIAFALALGALAFSVWFAFGRR
ncbi:MAG TPA: serine/threonine-protein kinase [Minicystis sp.]|nr:serine/threonine-protein kinase [Minicystis sp.]